MPSEIIFLSLSMLGVGVFGGFIGGLFGIGGGIVIVPVLFAVFGVIGVSDDVRMHLAVGTSLATIIVTSFRAVRAHAKLGAVDFDVLKAWAPWIAGGAALGAAIANFATGEVLTVIFALGALAVAWRMYFQATEERKGRSSALVWLSQSPGREGVSVGIGLFSSLMGIGGGVPGVVILNAAGHTIHQAVATASGFGLAVAAPGVVGFILAGQGAEGLPPGSLGYVSLVAFAFVASMTAITAPLGARLAHRLPKATLSRVFAIYLVVTAVLLFVDIIL